MKNGILIAIAMLLSCSWGIEARGEEWGKDPFFPSEKRPSGPAPASRDSDWGRDPFNNPFGRKATYQRPGARNLTGIIYGKKARLAIIGGEVLSEGGKVGDQRLVRIRRKSVELMNPSGRVETVFLEDFSIGK